MDIFKERYAGAFDKRRRGTMEEVMKPSSSKLCPKGGKLRSRSSYQVRQATLDEPPSLSSRPGSSISRVNLGSKEILEMVNNKRNQKYAGLNSKIFKNSFYRYYKSKSKNDIRLSSRENQGGISIGGSVDKRRRRVDRRGRRVSSTTDSIKVSEADPATANPRKPGKDPNPIYKDSVFIKSRLLQKMGISPSDILLNIDKCKENIRCKLLPP